MRSLDITDIEAASSKRMRCPDVRISGFRETMTSDEQLILELKQGSEPAFTELFLRYRERIWGFFRRRMNDAAQAEELAQETFLAVLRGAQRYEPRATFRAYLFGIAFNILAADRRKSVSDQTSAHVVPDDMPALPRE